MVQVRLTSSNSKRMQVKDLIDDIEAELKATCKVDLDVASKPQLLQISLQRDEDAEERQDPKVCCRYEACCICHYLHLL